jgi:hypothetical protein
VVDITGYEAEKRKHDDDRSIASRMNREPPYGSVWKNLNASDAAAAVVRPAVREITAAVATTSASATVPTEDPTVDLMLVIAAATSTAIAGPTPAAERRTSQITGTFYGASVGEYVRSRHLRDRLLVAYAQLNRLRSNADDSLCPRCGRGEDADPV